MPIKEGTDRDVFVIHAVREAAGPDAKILIDANNGTTLNIAKNILERCEDVGIYWFEEAFPEDRAFNEAFRAFIDEKGYNTFVADGESGPPPPYFFDMVEKGWINIVQQDFHGKGLTWWRETAKMIEPWGGLCGPHSWGSVIERYAHAHFAASVPNFSLLEAAPVDMPGVRLDGWDFQNSCLVVPDTPGTGFDLEPELIEEGVKTENGFRVHA
jgi:L-alanine-DL-glutamate epimerase-like enolase superfamily enzyme